MVLGGRWHGAAWTCAIWGAIHGVGLAADAARVGPSSRGQSEPDSPASMPSRSRRVSSGGNAVGRRALVRDCLDWTERREHLAHPGARGAPAVEGDEAADHVEDGPDIKCGHHFSTLRSDRLPANPTRLNSLVKAGLKGGSHSGPTHEGFGPIHRNPRSINYYPGLGFPGEKSVTGVRLFLGRGPLWFRASPLRLQRRSP